MRYGAHRHFRLKFGSLSRAVALKMKSKSPKPIQLFIISQCYIHAYLLKILLPVHEISRIQESVTLMQTGSAPITIHCMSPSTSVGNKIKDQITSLVEAYINLLLKGSWSEASSGSLYCLFDLGFMALHHLYGHFRRGHECPPRFSDLIRWRCRGLCYEVHFSGES